MGRDSEERQLEVKILQYKRLAVYPAVYYKRKSGAFYSGEQRSEKIELKKGRKCRVLDPLRPLFCPSRPLPRRSAETFMCTLAISLNPSREDTGRGGGIRRDGSCSTLLFMQYSIY